MIKTLLFTLCLIVASNTVHSQTLQWTTISTGAEFSCAVRSDGTLWCWGANLNGQIANGEVGQTPISEPFNVEGSDWKTVSCGAAHTIGIKEDGSLWGWGSNGVAQVSGDADANVVTPFLIDDKFEWIKVNAGQGHTLAIRSDSTLWGWGFNAFSQVTGSISGNIMQLFDIDTESKWIDISAGGAHSLGLKADSTVWGWGFSGNGQIGPILGTQVFTPRKIGPDSLSWKSISAGFEFSAAITTDGNIYTTGFNGNGQLGTGDMAQRMEWTLIDDSGDWVSLNCGSAYTMAINEAGELYGWGANLEGACGIDNGDANILMPTLVDDENIWTEVSAATGLSSGNSVFGFHTLALKEDTEVICTAGANYIGQLGNGLLESLRTFRCETTVIETSTANPIIVDTQVLMYPQPAIDECFVTVEDQQITRWRLMDMNGMVVDYSEIEASESIRLDVSHLPAGSYILGLFTKDGLINRKMIKQ